MHKTTAKQRHVSGQTPYNSTPTGTREIVSACGITSRARNSSEAPLTSIIQRTPEWLEARKKGIGGSDAPAVLGVSPWRTALDVYYEKTDPNYEPKPETEAMRWGAALEPVMRTEYVRRTGYEITATNTMLRHPEHEWMIASLDGMTSTGRVLELKTTRHVEGWGEPYTDQIPMHYLPQVHHYMAVTGAGACDVAVLIGGSDFRIYVVEADPELAEQIIDAEAAFWAMVRAKEPPSPASVADAILRWGKFRGTGSIIATPELLHEIDTLRRIKEAQKSLKQDEEAAKLAIFSEIADHGDTVTDARGNVLATWKMMKGSTYTTTRPEGRVLRLKNTDVQDEAA